MSDANRTAVRYAKEASYAAAIGGAYSTGAYTFSGAPSNADTVTINGLVYTFKTGSLVAARDVAAGASAAAAAANLAAAIIADPANAGTSFYSGTLAHPDVVAYASSGVCTLYAKLHGAGGDAITTTESSTAITVGGGTLAGGADSNYATMTEVRYNNHTLKHQKVTVESEQIRSDRMASGQVKVGISAGGDINHELHYGDFNSWIVSALMGVIVTGTDTDTDYTLSGGVLTKGAAWPANLSGAKFVKMSGWTGATGNNGIKRVISSTSTSLTLEGVSDDAAGESVTIAWNYARNGTTLESYIVETEQSDAGIVIPIVGMCINEWYMTFEPRAKIMTRFGWVGYGLPSGTISRTDTVGNAVAAPSLNPIINTTSNIARLLQSGLPARAYIRNMEWTLNNGLRERLALSREGTLQPGTGECNVSGRLSTYFDNKFEYDDFLAHTDMGLEFSMVDSAGRTINVYVPAIQLGEGTYDVPGLNQDVMLNRTFKAKAAVGHDGSTYEVQVDMLEP